MVHMIDMAVAAYKMVVHKVHIYLVSKLNEIADNLGQQMN